ncbi:MAG: lysophospholipid acyltransferase family protein [Aminobacteriaceae bacterium]
MTLFNRVFYFFVKWFFFISLKVYNRLSIGWTSALPERNVIVAANHTSNLDPVIMGAVFPRRLRYLAKEDLFKPFFLGGAIRALGAIPVRKSDSQRAGAALRTFLKLLESGENVLIFPEGGRSTDGELQPLEGGVALIALKSGAPIVPAYISGAFKAMPPGSLWVKPGRLSIVFGEVIDSSKYIPLGNEGRRSLLKDLGGAFYELSGGTPSDGSLSS